MHLVQSVISHAVQHIWTERPFFVWLCGCYSNHTAFAMIPIVIDGLVCVDCRMKIALCRFDSLDVIMKDLSGATGFPSHFGGTTTQTHSSTLPYTHAHSLPPSEPDPGLSGREAKGRGSEGRRRGQREPNVTIYFLFLSLFSIPLYLSPFVPDVPSRACQFLRTRLSSPQSPFSP